MSEFFILQNQAKLFLGKQKDWLDGRDPASLFKTSHKDEAINQLVEISAKDYTQRIRVLSCNLNEKGAPLISEEDLPPPLPKVAKAIASDSAEESVNDAPDDADVEEELVFTTDNEPDVEIEPQTPLL